MHEVLEKYYLGKISKEDMVSYYLIHYKDKVRGKRPPAEIPMNYMKSGAEYLRNFAPLPYSVLGVERKLDFDLDRYKFTSRLDYIGEKDGEIYLVDNKSRCLKQRSKRSKPTIKDQELDSMLKQLYLYSIPVEKEFGKLPSYLCFNCFRNGEFIKEKFNNEAFEEAKKWALNSIKEIEADSDFLPKENQFMCNWICPLSKSCEYAEETKEEWRRFNSHDR